MMARMSLSYEASDLCILVTSFTRPYSVHVSSCIINRSANHPFLLLAIRIQIVVAVHRIFMLKSIKR